MYKHFWCFVYKRFDVKYKFKISRPKYIFLWCLFLTKKWIQNWVYKNVFFFYYEIDWKCTRSLHFVLLSLFIFFSFSKASVPIMLWILFLSVINFFLSVNLKINVCKTGLQNQSFKFFLKILSSFLNFLILFSKLSKISWSNSLLSNSLWQ